MMKNKKKLKKCIYMYISRFSLLNISFRLIYKYYIHISIYNSIIDIIIKELVNFKKREFNFASNLKISIANVVYIKNKY